MKFNEIPLVVLQLSKSLVVLGIFSSLVGGVIEFEEEIEGESEEGEGGGGEDGEGEVEGMNDGGIGVVSGEDIVAVSDDGGVVS